MATVDHTPKGRGYDTSFGYFHHANDYWTEHVGAYVDLYNETEATDWAGPAPAFAPLRDGPVRQDRLVTNIGKTQKESVFSGLWVQRLLPGRRLAAIWRLRDDGAGRGI
jgi:hypothetical protein